MQKIKTYKILALASLIVVALMASTMFTSAQTVPTEINGTEHQEHVDPGTYIWQFRNMHQERTQFQLQTNASLDCDMDCDCDNIGAKEFRLELNIQTNLRLQVKMNASDSSIGLGDGQQVKTQSQNQYRFRHRFMVQLELNNTGPIQARLQINISDTASTWAYYHAEDETWIPVTSTIEEGLLTAETDHFSTWAILTLESPSIDGYSLVIIVGTISIATVLLIKRKRST